MRLIAGIGHGCRTCDGVVRDVAGCRILVGSIRHVIATAMQEHVVVAGRMMLLGGHAALYLGLFTHALGQLTLGAETGVHIEGAPGLRSVIAINMAHPLGTAVFIDRELSRNRSALQFLTIDRT